jgi:hypothetical protein
MKGTIEKMDYDYLRNDEVVLVAIYILDISVKNEHIF